MKKFFATLLIALTLALGATAVLLPPTQAHASELKPYFIYTEYENIDGSFSTSIYFSLPESYCVRFGIATVDLDHTLPSLLAYEMFARPYGEELDAVVSFPGGRATYNDSDKGINWLCESTTQDGEYIMQATMTFVSGETFLDYLARRSVFGVRTIYRTDGYQQGKSRFDESRIFMQDTAFYRTQGVKLVEPMADVMAGWQAGFTDQTNDAFGVFWYGKQFSNGTEIKGLRSIMGEYPHFTYDSITENMIFAYQFCTPNFNGSNGGYMRMTGLRAGAWQYTVNGSDNDSPNVAKMIFRSPRLWVWYLTGAIIVVGIGVAVYFILRHNERVRKAYEQRMNSAPYNAPFTSPVEPFEDYGTGAGHDPSATPFGNEYENRDE